MAGSDGPRNIIMIVADSLRFDSVYQGGGPGMPYTEANSMQFIEARSNGCWTLPATASIFTGLMPHEHGATSQSRKLNSKVVTLAERLKEANYRTIQITANVATTEIFGLDRGFDRIIKIWKQVVPQFRKALRFTLMMSKPRMRRMLFSKDALVGRLSEDIEVGNCWVQNTFRDTFRKTRQILRRNKTLGRKCFLFLNLMESHFPYHVAPTFRLTAGNWKDKIRELVGLLRIVNQSFLVKDDGDAAYIKPRISTLLKNRQYLSWKLLAGELDSFIRELHDDKDNLVVFCSDHGDNFGEQNWYYHFSNVTDAGNRVPIFWLGHDHHGPGVVETPLSARFLFNSILQSCGLIQTDDTLFSDSQLTLPIMQSYWYNNNNKTLRKYRYNQFCFVQDDERYLMRGGRWYRAPVGGGLPEPHFLPLEADVDPVQEAVMDRRRRNYLIEALKGFNAFCSTLAY